MGYNKNVVILTRHSDYKKKAEFGKIVDTYYRKFPKFVQSLKERHTLYNDTISYIRGKKEDGAVFVIQPKQALAIGRLERNPEKVQLIYNQGYQDGLANIEKVKKFLEG